MSDAEATIVRALLDASEEADGAAPARERLTTWAKMAGFAKYTLLDPRLLVWEDEAFLAYRASTEYDRACRIIGLRQGTAHVRMDAEENPLLPALVCAAPSMPGATDACGAPMPAVRYGESGGVYYTNGNCEPEEHGHRASVHRCVEGPVLDMVAEAYDGPALERLVQGAEFRWTAMRSDLPKIVARTRRLRALFDVASRRELEASTDNRTADIDMYGRQRQLLQAEMEASERLEQQVRRDLRGGLTPRELEQTLQQVRALAGRLDHLLPASRAVPGLTRRLLRFLTQEIRVRKLTTAMSCVEVLFPNQSRARRLVVTDAIRSFQGARAFAFAALRRGETPEDVARAFVALDLTPTREGVITADAAQTMALQHAFFDETVYRMGPAELPARVAARLEVEEAVLRGAMVRDQLGPVWAFPDGQLGVTPTDVELQQVCPSVGARVVAARMGWSVEDTIPVAAVAAQLGVRRNAFSTKDWPIVRDDAFGAYVHRNTLTSSHVAETIERLARRTKAFEVARDRAIVAAGFDPAAAGDFVPIHDLQNQLRRLYGGPARESINRYARKGVVASVQYRGPAHVERHSTHSTLVFCPLAIRTTYVPDELQAWREGKRWPAKRPI